MPESRKTKPGGPKGHRWYSICSKHRDYDASCNCCNAGQWCNERRLYWEGLLFKVWPWLWRKWINRKSSSDRKFIEDTFPNLKSKDK